MLRKILSVLLVVTMLASLSSCALLRESVTVTTETQKEKPSESIGTGGTVTEGADGTATEGAETDPVPSLPTKNPGDPFTVCIDPGHGYVDPGSTSDYLEGKWEREIVREYAEKLKSELEAAGCRVIMLWDEDRYVTASEVVSAAKAAGVEFKEEKIVDDRRFAAYNRAVWANVLHRETYIDLIVSIHVNTYPADESVKGTRIYYCSETDRAKESGTLCANLTYALSQTLPSQKVRYYADKAENAFIMTKVPEMASALVEIGFATNPTEAKNILDTEWMDSFVDGLCRGIRASGN